MIRPFPMTVVHSASASWYGRKYFFLALVGIDCGRQFFEVRTWSLFEGQSSEVAKERKDFDGEELTIERAMVLAFQAEDVWLRTASPSW